MIENVDVDSLMESNDISVRPYKHQVLFVISPYTLIELLSQNTSVNVNPMPIYSVL